MVMPMTTQERARPGARAQVEGPRRARVAGGVRRGWDYRDGLARSRTRLAELEAEADVWRRDGQAVLDACVDWMTLELDVLTARTMTEQQEPGSDRRTLLQRERDRVDEARNVLTSL